MKQKVQAALAAIMIMAMAGLASGDEISELRKQVEMLSKKLEKLEAQQQQQKSVFEEQIDKVAAQKSEAKLPDSLKWAETLKFYGDFRYRHESIDDETASEQRDRNRIRARLGVKAKVNDEFGVNFRLASGDDDPVSTNETLDDSFSTKDIRLDRAYAIWTPNWSDPTTIQMGKMGVPFFKAGGNQLIWDDDLSVEGVSANYGWSLNDNTSAEVTGAGFWVDERSSDVDTSLWGIQGLINRDLSSDSSVTAGATYYDYGNIEGIPTTTIGTLSSDYNIFEALAEYSTKINSVPVKVYGNWVNNTAADTGEDTGYLLGMTYNKAKKQGTWQLGYQYRDLEQEAVVGAFSDSDFIGGGTNGKGHKFSFAYALAKNTTAGVTYFMNEKGDDETDYDRLQIDLKYKF
ncbi:hypothetical protein STSP2_02713 [Anaerohalosphaera lusitana]|uniref:Porin n=1 Tax=Anaerohalosphaera lusitana TaxID=1936003 RepID=A0A1U9NNK0_9BACT|nr:putative porin [Anaerohalosphaera lusitana]AQT69522.1 hypothetical protein STSP2_02713 [Anaerohalosphaera lusitana]